MAEIVPGVLKIFIVLLGDKECGVEGKLLLLAREDGFLDGVDLHSKSKVRDIK